MLLKSLKLRGKELIIDTVSRPIGSHFIELNDVMPQNSFAISLTGVLQKEMQVGGFAFVFVTDIFWFLPSPVL